MQPNKIPIFNSGDKFNPDNPNPFQDPASLSPPTGQAMLSGLDAEASARVASDSAGGKKKPRNIVLLLDGTGKEFCDHNSNLIKLMSVLKADETQYIYYSSGLGTVLPDSTSSWAAIRQQGAKVIDLALAWNFEQFVCDAYTYLMNYHTEDARVFLFGFSRGAYVARALAGMIQKVGLLPPGSENQVKTAYRVYTEQDPPTRDVNGLKQSALYRRIFGLSRPVSIEFIGCWDTVSSLGGLGLPRLPFAGGVSGIKFFRQALALDERRARFVPEYRHPDRGEDALRDDVRSKEKALAQAEQANDQATATVAKTALQTSRDILEKTFPTYAPTLLGMMKKRKMEVWFMGCHSDVGGGRDPNDLPALSNVPFRWMLREAVDCGIRLSATGVAFLPALQIAGVATAPGEAGRTDIPKPETFANLLLLKQEVIEQMQDVRAEQAARDKAEEIDDAIEQEELAKIVRMAAARDSADGAPTLSRDALQPVRESLTGPWRILEWIPIVTRRYETPGVEPNDPGGDSVWAVNRGNSRQMVPGQLVHGSVLRRLLHDRIQDNFDAKGNPVNVEKHVSDPRDGPLKPVGDREYLKYKPAAKIGEGFPSWDDPADPRYGQIWEM